MSERGGWKLWTVEYREPVGPFERRADVPLKTVDVKARSKAEAKVRARLPFGSSILGAYEAGTPHDPERTPPR